MTIRNAFEQYVKSLSAVYDHEEAARIAQWLFEERAGLTGVDIITRGDETLSEVKANDLTWKLLRLMKGEPVQYVLGICDWFGMRLKVNNHVLIPRPETEELVEWILDEERKFPAYKQRESRAIRVLDIGTGSGCIALALKMNLADAEVTALDISEAALEVARDNASEHSLSIHFVKGNILGLQSELAGSVFDLIVSNPPYVTASEKESVQRNVNGYEPHVALFVPDENPLLFYDAIISYASLHLSKEGKLYFEINPVYAEQLILHLTGSGFSQTELRTDLSGKPRMLKASR
jgi:release factor glutamine methyltransferase